MLHLPGLTLYIGSSPKAWGAPDDDRLTIQSFQGSNVNGFLRKHPFNDVAGVYVDKQHRSGIALDAGPDLLCGSRRAQPRAILEAFLSDGPSFVATLDGQFLLVVWDEDKGVTLLASDRYGLRPHYSRQQGAGLLIGTSAQEIAAYDGRPLQVNEQWVYSMLSYSRVTPGTITAFEGYYALPPATLMVWNDQVLNNETPYWDYFDRSICSDSRNIVNDCSEALIAGVLNSFSTGLSSGLCLSGGLDSRLIAAALSTDDSMKEQVTAFTWGVKEHSDEIRIAAQVAKHFKMSWKFLGLEPNDFIQNIEQAVNLIEGRDHGVQGYGLRIFDCISKSCSVVSSGLALDVLSSSSYASLLPQNLQQSGSFDAIWEGVLAKLKYFKSPPSEVFLDPNFAIDNINAVVELLRKDFDCDGIEPINGVDRFILRQRVWRQIFPRQQWSRFFVEDASPSFSNRLIELLLSIPPELRLEKAVGQQLLQQIAPRALDIDYQRTLMPMKTPPRFWSAAIALEEKREALYRNIFYEMKGAFFIPYNRYYSNFDEWQRTEPVWIKEIDRLLLGPDAQLPSRFVRRDWLSRIIKEQREGSRTHFAQINVLVSVEQLLRIFG